jgi:ppGpp synthetase/RelA/SpoT-type nucleotidyltranferase
MDPKKLRKAYKQHLPKLNKIMGHVKEQLSDLPSSEFTLETNLKPYTSIKEKMERDHARDPSELSDLVRGRLFFSDQFDQNEVVDLLSEIFGKNIKDVDDKRHRSKEHGLEYHGIVHVDLNFDGTNFELQVMPVEFKPYKEFLHQIYEKFRNPKTYSKLSDKQKDLLKKVHNNLYKKLHDSANSNREKES